MALNWEMWLEDIHTAIHRYKVNESFPFCQIMLLKLYYDNGVREEWLYHKLYYWYSK